MQFGDRYKLITLSKYLIPCAILLFGVFYLQTFAQEQNTGLIVSPASLVEELKTDQVIDTKFRITNQRGNDENIVIKSREISFDENGEKYIPEGSNNDVMSSFEREGWLEFEPKEFLLKQGEYMDVKVKLQLPPDAPTKGYYLEMAATIKPNESDQNSVGTIPEIVLPIAVNYLGSEEVIKNFEIFSFTTDKYLYEFNPVHFTTLIRNTGNVNSIIGGQILISRDPKLQKDSEIIPFDANLIVAKSGEKFQNTWNDGFVYEDENGNWRIDWNKTDKIRFGHYYAQLSLFWDKGNGKEIITREVSFWIIPWRLILGIISIPTMYMLFKKFKKKYNDKKDSK